MREYFLSLFTVRSSNLLTVQQTGFTNAATSTPADPQYKRSDVLLYKTQHKHNYAPKLTCAAETWSRCSNSDVT